jgi:hypothetical protein
MEICMQKGDPILTLLQLLRFRSRLIQNANSFASIYNTFPARFFCFINQCSEDGGEEKGEKSMT